MKIMVIGSSGAGKSTFSKKLSERTGYPLLHLDKIWHETDYSDSALAYFKKVQKQFIAENENCIVDGNYSGTMETRLPSADLIIWLKISRLKALRRVISRSLKTRFAGKNRSDMATNFVEKFDKEYWEFMKFIWNFPKKMNLE
ncbi:AAA family ATPase [Lactococcus fujiensis]|uniref:AAA family ATPase n=1 Tax=Lactococcus fujiensis TaxID=610251 RepID=UPI000A531B6C|nr:AAA family ATPase [Lactococcus fujiensis]